MSATLSKRERRLLLVAQRQNLVRNATAAAMFDSLVARGLISAAGEITQRGKDELVRAQKAMMATPAVPIEQQPPPSNNAPQKKVVPPRNAAYRADHTKPRAPTKQAPPPNKKPSHKKPTR